MFPMRALALGSLTMVLATSLVVPGALPVAPVAGPATPATNQLVPLPQLSIIFAANSSAEVNSLLTCSVTRKSPHFCNS